MKIEKINENQIRCTLTSSDLASRQIDLGELAYGSDKAKSLFHDMMVQARSKFGFDSENAPLMIEAIPVSPDSIVLIISKVDDPEELDTRFSRFTQSEEGNAKEGRQLSGADSILDLFRTLAEAKAKAEPAKEQEAPASCPIRRGAEETKKDPRRPHARVNLVQAFLFRSLDDVIAAAGGLNGFYTGRNSLYKVAEGDYRLVVHQSGCAPEKFNKVCNILSEYGENLHIGPAAEAHLLEHSELLLAETAVLTLQSLC